MAPRPKGMAVRLLEKIEHDTNGGCWLWSAKINRTGYGGIKHSWHGGGVLSHRAAYTEFVGPIPDGLFVCHKCDVRTCINPDHLFLGTALDNNRDAGRKGRSARGERHGQSKLSLNQARQIKMMLDKGEKRKTIAKTFGIGLSPVDSIAQGRHWSC
jgi:hypothetical protein